MPIVHRLLPDGYTLFPVEEDSTEIWERLREADFIGVIGKFFTREMMTKVRSARLIQAFSAGFDTIDAGTTFEVGIPLATTKGANEVSVAEHVFCMLINLQRRIP